MKIGGNGFDLIVLLKEKDLIPGKVSFRNIFSDLWDKVSPLHRSFSMEPGICLGIRSMEVWCMVSDPIGQEDVQKSAASRFKESDPLKKHENGTAGSGVMRRNIFGCWSWDFQKSIEEIAQRPWNHFDFFLIFLYCVEHCWTTQVPNILKPHDFFEFRGSGWINCNCFTALPGKRNTVRQWVLKCFRWASLRQPRILYMSRSMCAFGNTAGSIG